MSLSSEKIKNELTEAVKTKNLSLVSGLGSVAGLLVVLFDYHSPTDYLYLENEDIASWVALGLFFIALFSFLESEVKATEIEDIKNRIDLMTHASEAEQTDEESENYQEAGKHSRQKSARVLSFQFPHQTSRN